MRASSTIEAECLSCLLVDLATGVAARVSPEMRRHLLRDLVRFLELDQGALCDFSVIAELAAMGAAARTDTDWETLVDFATVWFHEVVPHSADPSHRIQLSL